MAISSLLIRQHLQVEINWFLIQLYPKIKQKKEKFSCSLILITILQNKAADHWFLHFPCHQLQNRIRNETLHPCFLLYHHRLEVSFLVSFKKPFLYAGHRAVWHHPEVNLKWGEIIFLKKRSLTLLKQWNTEKSMLIRRCKSSVQQLWHLRVNPENMKLRQLTVQWWNQTVVSEDQ